MGDFRFAWFQFQSHVTEPQLHDVSHGRVGVEIGKQGRMVDVIETSRYVGIEHKFRFVSNGVEDGFDGILT